MNVTAIVKFICGLHQPDGTFLDEVHQVHGRRVDDLFSGDGYYQAHISIDQTLFGILPTPDSSLQFLPLVCVQLNPFILCGFKGRLCHAPGFHLLTQSNSVLFRWDVIGANLMQKKSQGVIQWDSLLVVLRGHSFIVVRGLLWSSRLVQQRHSKGIDRTEYLSLFVFGDV